MRFEQLTIWRTSISFATDIYTLSSQFPRQEMYGVTSQLRRASHSISLNIAEGSGRGTKNDFARFIDISIGSTLECISALHLCRNLNFIDSVTFQKYYRRAESLCKSLYSFKKTLKK